jgi:hypothetical protein
MDELIASLRASKDHHRLFEARTLQAKQELGLPLLRTTDLAQASPEIRQHLENRLMEACREVGQLILAEGDIPGAYVYFQMIGELEPVREALDTKVPPADEVPSLVDIALYRQVHPARGIALVLEHYGLCQAITACESLFGSPTPSVARQASVEQIIQRLHQDLSERLASEIASTEGSPPPPGTLADWVASRDWLFEAENYHIDTSHLNSAVRMARLIEPTTLYRQAADLCSYGERLSPRYKYPDPEPFADVYADSRRFFLAMLDPSDEKSLAYFQQKAESLDPSKVGTYPIEVYLRMLQARGRHADAIRFGTARPELVGGSLATLVDSICEEAGDYSALAVLARQRQNGPAYLAALLAGGSS